MKIASNNLGLQGSKKVMRMVSQQNSENSYTEPCSQTFSNLHPKNHTKNLAKTDLYSIINGMSANINYHLHPFWHGNYQLLYQIWTCCYVRNCLSYHGP